MRIKFILLVFVAMSLVVPTVTVNAEVIYSEDFSGDSSDINGTTPDVSATGAAWVAAPIFNQDGSLNPNPGSMTLAFTPDNGLIYTLDASLRGVTGDASWLALGFADGQSSKTSSSSRFVNADVLGIAWMLFRGDISTYSNKTQYGGTLDNAADWTALTDLTTDVDMRIVLDTTGGTGNWAVTWYAKAPADIDYTQVGTAVLPEVTINSVGLASSGSGVDGTIESFSLSDNLNLTNPDVDAGSDWITWSDEPVTLDDVVVTNNDPDAGELTLTWTAENIPGISVGFSATDVSDPTISIIKDSATENPTTVTLTLTVTQTGKDPVMDSMQIDVYDTACDAGQAVGAVTLDLSDFNADCITDIEDLATLAGSWLVNYQADGPAVK